MGTKLKIGYLPLGCPGCGDSKGLGHVKVIQCPFCKSGIAPSDFKKWGKAKDEDFKEALENHIKEEHPSRIGEFKKGSR